ncbi:MAG: GTP-sensing pleiotropic transcriptional regulator CodY [Lachnospiraceae bacterium]|nr:GTP-sensing pleiotropic transcriptional regulator CodY [Lachnospiraceae bacterium]
MGVQLLDKTRKLNNLLHNNSSNKVVFNDMCDVLSDVLASRTLILSKKGKLLGYSISVEMGNGEKLIPSRVGEFVDKDLNERLLEILSTKENVNLETLGFEGKFTDLYNAIVTPISIAGERYGTMFAYRADKKYNIDDIILSEYGATIAGLELIRSHNEETEEIYRNSNIVSAAVATLSSSEKEAICEIMKKIRSEKSELIIASRISQETGITRSIIVNALRKLESAGVIKCKGAGMKGTRIRVLNTAIYSQLGII